MPKLLFINRRGESINSRQQKRRLSLNCTPKMEKLPLSFDYRDINLVPIPSSYQVSRSTHAWQKSEITKTQRSQTLERRIYLTLSLRKKNQTGLRLFTNHLQILNEFYTTCTLGIPKKKLGHWLGIKEKENNTSQRPS